MNEQALKRADDRLTIPDLGRRARFRRAVAVAIALGAAGLGAAYYGRPKPVVELYRTERLSRRTIVQRVETTGIIDVRSRVEVPAPTAGRLTSIAVAPRQQVKQGELLATLDERAAALQVRNARLGVDAAAGRLAQAQAGFDAARRDQEQAQRLQDKGLASAQDLDDAKSALERAKAALEAARADKLLASGGVASSELSQSLSRIVSPVAGVVLLSPDRLGAAVSPERGPLFEIGAPLSLMRVDAPVSETEIALIAPGRKAEVVVQALPGKTFSAVVDRIGIEPKREGGVALYPVTLLVQNPDGELLPGMSARVRMEVARVENALAAHDAALRFDPDGAAAAATPRSRVWRRRGPAELQALSVRAGISDGVYTSLEPEGPASLHEDDDLAIGLLHPGQSAAAPSMSLGKR